MAIESADSMDVGPNVGGGHHFQMRPGRFSGRNEAMNPPKMAKISPVVGMYGKPMDTSTSKIPVDVKVKSPGQVLEHPNKSSIYMALYQWPQKSWD